MPVIEKTLCNVVSHVKSSAGHVMCLSTDVPLQFVFSSEQSMRHFVEVGCSSSPSHLIICDPSDQNQSINQSINQHSFI